MSHARASQVGPRRRQVRSPRAGPGWRAAATCRDLRRLAARLTPSRWNLPLWPMSATPRSADADSDHRAPAHAPPAGGRPALTGLVALEIDRRPDPADAQ